MSRLKYLIPATFLLALFLTQTSCWNVRIKDHKEWKQYFEKYPGMGDACFEMYDNNKEIAMYYNIKRCSKRLAPGAVFDIFSALTALSENVALDESFKLAVKDSANQQPDSLTLKQAFRQNNEAYFQKLVQVVGYKKMKHCLDTVQFGNKKIAQTDNYYTDGTLLVTPDEMVGFMKDLYHGELKAFDQRSMRLVQDMMLQETKPAMKLYYRTATIPQGDSSTHWVVGIWEHSEALINSKTKILEHIPHPYFFAMNFKAANNQQDWNTISLQILKDIAKAEHINH